MLKKKISDVTDKNSFSRAFGIIDFYETKITDCNTWLALRSLSYFEDAERQPKMYIDVNWETVKDTIKKAIAT